MKKTLALLLTLAMVFSMVLPAALSALKRSKPSPKSFRQPYKANPKPRLLPQRSFPAKTYLPEKAAS